MTVLLLQALLHDWKMYYADEHKMIYTLVKKSMVANDYTIN